MKRFASSIPGTSVRRHPDRDCRVDSLLPGRSTTTPAGYFYSSALAAALAILVPLVTLRFGPTSASPGAATTVTIFAFVFTLVMAFIALVCCRKGIRWRNARRAYSQASGQTDLGWFGIWDGLGERTEEEIAGEAEELVRTNKARLPE